MKGTWQTTDSSGSGLGVAVAVIAAAVLAVPVIDALARVAEVFVITVGILAVLALAAGAALVVYRVRGPQNPLLVVHRVTPVTRRPAEPLPAPRPAVEAPREVHLHFYGVSAEEATEIMQRRVAG